MHNRVFRRTEFPTLPQAWTRAGRVATDPVRYAAAIERRADRFPLEWADGAIAALLAAFVALVALGVA